MKVANKATVSGFLAALWIASSGYSAQDVDTHENLDQINAVIKSALSEIVPEYKLFEEFNYSFIPEQTDITKDRFFFNIEATLKNPPWEQDKSLKVKGNLGFAIRPDGQKGMTIYLAKSIDGDPLKLLHYLTNNFALCPVPADIQGVIRLLGEKDCANVQNILAAQSLSDLKATMMAHANSSQVAVANYLQEISAAKSAIANETLSQFVAHEMTKAANILQGMKTIKFQDYKDGFTVSSGEIKFSDLFVVKEFQYMASSNQTSFSATVYLPFGEALYDAAKPEISRMINNFQEPYVKELIKLDARIWLNLIEKMITKAPVSEEIKRGGLSYVTRRL